MFFSNDTRDEADSEGIESTQDEYLSNNPSAMIPPPPLPSTATSKVRQKALDDAMLDYLEGLNKKDDEGLFGEHTAASLRKLKPITKSHTKMRIQQILFEAEQCDLSKTACENGFVGDLMNTTTFHNLG